MVTVDHAGCAVIIIMKLFTKKDHMRMCAYGYQT